MAGQIGPEYQRLMAEIRGAIEVGGFEAYAREFYLQRAAVEAT